MLNVPKAFVVVAFSSEQLLVVECAVQLPAHRYIIGHATNEHVHVSWALHDGGKMFALISFCSCQVFLNMKVGGSDCGVKC